MGQERPVDPVPFADSAPLPDPAPPNSDSDPPNSTPHPWLITTPTNDARFTKTALQLTQAPPGTYHFTDWRPTDLPGKPGFGGSAAATVAAVLAARWLRDGVAPPARDVFETAWAAHRAVQGSGSGIDVAAAAYGGVLRYQDGQIERRAAVHPVIVWSGQSARTGPRIAQYLALADRDAFVAASTALIAHFDADPIAALDEARRLLESMADAAGLAYRTPALDRIAALARDTGGAAKPSGAGGGDCAIALFPDPERCAAFVRACAEAGFVVLDAAPCAGAHRLNGEFLQ